MSIIERVNSSEDVKKLNSEQLRHLSTEIRAFLIENISKTGGHLASNLGTVELTLALHRVYDSTVDRIVFDVGHQCYTHKIITGRREQFSTLRQHGGLSGFPKPYESVDDAFVAGHSSTSISVAVGMARARKVTGEDYDVVALIGDGAMTGGLAYEGLEFAASSGEPMVIILNDNNMSISKNVGGMSRLLASMRYRAGYISFKRIYRKIFKKIPKLYRFNHRVKEWLKSRLMQDNTFNQMGYEYLGPVDGHDIHALESAIGLAKEMEEPVIVHVITKKGKGCSYAEEHPDMYHGVGPFDPITGELGAARDCFSDVFGQSLCDLAEEDVRITAITAAMCSGTGLGCFEERFPDRFIDVGIAEGHAVAMAAGMAKQGALPVFAVYSSFLQRAYDMLIHDVALQGLHVVFGVDRAGLVGNDGETHHGVFDVGFLSSVPGMTILCPANFAELRAMLREALFNISGPVAIRYPRGGQGAYSQCHLEEESVLCHGKDLTLVCYGTMIEQALIAAELMKEKGVEAELIKLNSLRPNSLKESLASLEKTGRLIVVEDVCYTGSMGELILSRAEEQGLKSKGVELLNLGDGIVAHGTVSQLLHDHKLDGQGIAEAALKLCGK